MKIHFEYVQKPCDAGISMRAIACRPDLLWEVNIWKTSRSRKKVTCKHCKKKLLLNNLKRSI